MCDEKGGKFYVPIKLTTTSELKVKYKGDMKTYKPQKDPMD